MKKILALVLAVLMIVGCAACSGPATGEKLKVGFIFLHDENSTYDKNFLEAAEAATSELGLKPEQVIFKTNIPEGNECYEAAADLADQGCNIVFANSFGHEPYMLQAAKEFPNIQFCHATGTQAHTAEVPNFHNAFASIYQGRYLAGVAAGLKLNEMIKAYAKDAKIKYVDYHSALKDENNALPAKYAADGVHPNLECYKIMEEIILQYL